MRDEISPKIVVNKHTRGLYIEIKISIYRHKERGERSRAINSRVCVMGGKVVWLYSKTSPTVGDEIKREKHADNCEAKKDQISQYFVFGF
jgi:hypothetical protein